MGHGSPFNRKVVGTHALTQLSLEDVISEISPDRYHTIPFAWVHGVARIPGTRKWHGDGDDLGGEGEPLLLNEYRISF